ncbi:hypothetical protein [Streptomyces katrae]|uniref:hypothetical protein n=1 Tax=Streptomyces katrae TaxID=68223 RepID=UPI0004C064DA|nr:hypothetical protein [Streptomyces katrae]
MADILPADTTSQAVAELTPAPASAPTIARLDVPAAVVEAAVHLTELLAHPPLGHVEELQPADWYEAVFRDLAAAHPEKCTKPKQVTS